MVDWDDLRFFLAVARTGSLSGAAAALSSSSATVGRRVKDFETAIGATCFIRLANGYELTETGRMLLADAGRAEDAIAYIMGKHGGVDAAPRGRVRLAVPPEFAEYLLIPRLPSLLARHPDLRLEIVTGVDVVDVNRLEADVAFRSVRPENGQYTRVRRLADFPFSLYATRGFAERHCPAGPLPDTLPLVSRLPAYERLTAQRWIRTTLPTARIVVTVTTLREVVAACRLGIGAAVLPDFIGEPEPDLVPLGRHPAFHVPKWLLVHSGSADTARVRAVIEWLTDAFKPCEAVPPSAR